MNPQNALVEDLEIEGMSCSHCIDAVQRALAGIEGVEVEEVAIGRARVKYPAASILAGQLEQAIEDAGFRLVGTRQIS